MVNTDPQRSTTYCGCDEAANWQCERHRGGQMGPRGAAGEILRDVEFFPEEMNAAEALEARYQKKLEAKLDAEIKRASAWARDINSAPTPGRPQGEIFPASAQGRKNHPVFTGVLMYFPDAIAEVAAVSKQGNDQHNPGQPLHWARGKSMDQMDTASRHMMDHGVGNVRDTDGRYHLGKAAWRLLAELQLTIEAEREGQ